MGESDMTILNQMPELFGAHVLLSQPGPLNAEPGKMGMDYGHTIDLCSPVTCTRGNDEAAAMSLGIRNRHQFLT